ncbi:putative hydrolase of the HAD superfamily [Friedmanniella endophytica]|uniref:Putative hydrolase of the HAD superfamily n=1 Tax=Microlunatus kandeliicorticis TaxID=1759536 RepID=A0A7W3IRK0_9ACTN|nr:HAD-IA family hydrolase [Microlunatus kandeliicorticis]MBA8793926.1 putative hydrolase of the HAD superfamily [Microlunatus kandeliicorticis]
MPTQLKAVLFDADGVIQSTPSGWVDDLRAMAPDDPDTFVDALMAAEMAPVRGQAGFRDTLLPVMAEFGVTVGVETVLEVWHRLVTDPGMLEAIAELRREGLLCALTTNQHDVRARLMRDELHYGDVFDAQFYSCELGSWKPRPEYFETVVRELGVAPEEALFVDDREDNVEGARSVGLRAEVFRELGGRAELDRILALHR